MSADSGSREIVEGEREDLWSMPTILDIEIIHVYYNNPVPYFFKYKINEMQEAVEMVVRTSKKFPVRALSPALYVGDFPVTEYGYESENLYRFVIPGPDIEKLKIGESIPIGWLGEKTKKMMTNFHFRIQKDEER